MRTGTNDKILKRMTELNGKVTLKIRDNLKGVAPFASKPIPPEELIYAKNFIGFQDLTELVNEFGADKVNELIFDITMMENRRKKSGTIPKETPQDTDSTQGSLNLGGFEQQVTPRPIQTFPPQVV